MASSRSLRLCLLEAHTLCHSKAPDKHLAASVLSALPATYRYSDRTGCGRTDSGAVGITVAASRSRAALFLAARWFFFCASLFLGLFPNLRDAPCDDDDDERRSSRSSRLHVPARSHRGSSRSRNVLFSSRSRSTGPAPGGNGSRIVLRIAEAGNPCWDCAGAGAEGSAEPSASTGRCWTVFRRRTASDQSYSSGSSSSPCDTRQLSTSGSSSVTSQSGDSGISSSIFSYDNFPTSSTRVVSPAYGSAPPSSATVRYPYCTVLVATTQARAMSQQ